MRVDAHGTLADFQFADHQPKVRTIPASRDSDHRVPGERQHRRGAITAADMRSLLEKPVSSG